MIKNLLLLAFLCIGLNAQSQTIDSIPAKEAVNHYDKVVKVYGTVTGGKWLQSSKITLLNIDGAFPNHALTVMFKAEVRNAFTYQPESYLKGKKIMITGMVIKYKDKPEIIVTESDQIKILE